MLAAFLVPVLARKVAQVFLGLAQERFLPEEVVGVFVEAVVQLAFLLQDLDYASTLVPLFLAQLLVLLPELLARAL